MAIDVYPTKMPVLSENVILRLKADGGIVFVDSETNQETDELKLFIKNRPADDEMRRNDSMNDVNYKNIELELIDMALPVDVIALNNSQPGGAMEGNPIATSEFLSEWPEIFEYIKKAIMLYVGVGNLDAYSNILSSKQNSNIDFKITKDRADEWILQLIEARSNNDFRYFNSFVKMIKNDFEMVSNYSYEGGNSDLIIAEKAVSNFDYESERQLDLDLMLRIQVIADTQLIIGNAK